jgi:hypothetical protein
VRAHALLVALVLLAGCSGGRSAALPDIGALRCESTDPLPAQGPGVSALTALAAKERAPLVGVIDHSGHGRAGPQPPIDVRGATKKALAEELRAAAGVACRLRTPDDARRAGYTLSSYYTEGIGTHWTKWPLVDAPFDPTHPSMLLYGPRLGTTQLVGFSYWVRTRDAAGPAGFAGPADRWHRHFGMCFDRTGLLLQEDLRSSALCRGIYLNGSDIWMLHAWVVPGAPNVWGTFAPLNPQLCSRQVADVNRCPGMQTP